MLLFFVSSVSFRDEAAASDTHHCEVLFRFSGLQVKSVSETFEISARPFIIMFNLKLISDIDRTADFLSATLFSIQKG